MEKHFGAVLCVVFCVTLIQSSHQASVNKLTTEENCDCAESYICKNGGRLDLTDHSMSCVCRAPYSGARCEIYMCKNGGTAVELIDGSYLCVCAVGFYGATCEQKDHCSCEPCENGGTCINGDDDFTCDCKPGYSGDRCEILSRDCSEIKAQGTPEKPTPSGVYTVQIGSQQTQVYCEMRSDGGWTVMQRRVNADVNFYRNWTEYEQGFGDLDGSLWIGNEKLNLLTSSAGTQILRVELTEFNGDTSYAVYSNFQIGNSSEKYSLKSLGTYSGDSGNSLSYPHLRMMFSTYDQNNALTGSVNCSERSRGGWWYTSLVSVPSCHWSNLNGDYKPKASYSSNYRDGLEWYEWGGYWYSYKLTQMMIRSAG